MLDSLLSPIAILDGEGAILDANAAWRDFGRKNGLTDHLPPIGTNYLTTLGASPQQSLATAAMAGIRAVLRGEQDRFETVYPCHTPDQEQWFLMRAHPLSGARAGKVLVSHHDVSLLKRTEADLLRAHQQTQEMAATLAERERFINSIADHMPGMVGYWDKSLHSRFANQAYLEWFGRSPQEMAGISIQELLGPALFALNEPYIRRALAGEKLHFERTLTKADGSIGYTLAHYIPDRNAQGEVVGFFVQVNDVSGLKQTELALKLAASVFDNTQEGIFVTDANNTILSVNPAFTRITGYTAAEAIGQTPHLLHSDRHDAGFFREMWQTLDQSGHWAGEVWNRRKDGTLFLEWQAISRIAAAQDQPLRYLSIFHDITELRSQQERIQHLAFYDALTDLPNRSLLMDRLEHQMVLARREKSGLVLMFLDLDRFKEVNDTLGHSAGDALLQAVAHKLQAQVRKSDTVARVGGDEFVILLGAPATQDEIARIAGQLIAVANEPLELRGQTAQVGLSIGIAVYPEDGQTPSSLVKSADSAMYAAKKAGKNTYRFCSTPG
nr:diguanylate cyclase [uncultured Albidiferax sp.]